MIGFVALLALCTPQQPGGELELIRLLEDHEQLTLSYLRTCATGDRDRDGFPDFALAHIDWDVGYKRDAGLVALISGNDGRLLGSGTGNSPNQRLGIGLADAGDVDADGLNDLIVGTDKTGWQTIDNYVRVHSGADGSILFQMQRKGGYSRLGFVVGGAGDMNLDGHADFFFADQNEAGGRGVVTLVSGRTFDVLRRYEGGPDDGIGFDAVFVGDADGDGVADLAASNHFYPGGTNNRGRVWLVSGATGLLLWFHDGQTRGDVIGVVLERAGDVNEDGAADVLSSSDEGGPGDEGAVLVLSGADGSVLRRYVAPAPGGNFGRHIVSGRDFDGDGVDEHLLSDTDIALPGAPERSGGAVLFSGADGSVLATFAGDERFGGRKGSSVLGRLEAEGAELFLLHEPGHVSPAGYGGSLEVWAFRPFIGLSRHEVSAAAGGTIAVQLHFPPQYSGHRYALLFSRSGRGPSDWRGLALPLAQDAVFWASAAGRYPAGVDHPVGILDAQASATARVQAGPQDLAAHVGTTFHLAAVVFDPASGLPIRTSVGAAFTVRQ